MLDSKKSKILEQATLEKIETIFKDENLAKSISKIAVHATILTLQEYEKMQNQCSEQ